jgi:hypothetical protein
MDMLETTKVVTAKTWHDDVEIVSDSQIVVSAVDHLDGIEPAMIEWWFSNMDAELYFQFHPCDHKKFAWTRGKVANSHIGATHLTYHQYGGASTVLRSEISFQPLENHYDTSLFDEHGVGMALFAIVHMVDENDVAAPDEAGRFVHVAIEREFGTEFRSRWWLNTNDDSDLDLMGTGRLRHVHEEFGFLQGFLRSLYPVGH